MNTDLRPSGIEGLGDMSWGTHFCMFYDTKEDLLNVLLQYFKAGLENNESCLWVTPEPLSPEETKRAMRQAGLEFERHLAEGQIEIVSYKDLYLAGGHFDTQQVLQGWIDKHDQAIAKGYTGLRCTGNTFWLEKHQWDSFAKYEAEIDRVLSKLQIIVLCTYSLERCSAVDVLDVVHHHQFTVAKRNGVWEHLGGSELKRAHDEIQQLNAKLEQRVMERTAELTAMNEQLRREIADRERTEALVQAKEEEFRAIVENTPDQIIRYDRNLNRIYVNPAVTKAYALSKEAFIGKPVGSIVTDARLVVNTEEVEAQRRRIQAVFDTGEPNETEVTWPLPAGRRTFSSRLFPEFDPNGEVISVLGIARDITEHKRAEEAIRKSEQVLREAESLGHTGSWEQNLVTGEIFNTEENLRLFFGDDRGKGANFEDYTQTVHPDDHEYLLRRRAELLEEEGPSDIEYRVIWPDGSIHVIFGRATVVRNELGQAIRVYGTNVDITERKQAEEEIRRHAARMEVLAKISRALAEVGLDVQAVFETIVRYTAELIGDTCVIRLLSSDEQWLQSVTFHNPNPEVKALMRRLHPTTPTSANDSWLTPVLQTGQPLLIPVITQEQLRRSVQPEYLPFFEQVGLHSMLVVPLRVKGRVIGTLGLSRDQPGHPYTPDDQVLLQDLADRASLTIQNAQLFEQVQGTRQRLEALSRRLLEVQESERRALTRELHDRVGQNLTGLGITLQNMKALLSGEAAQRLAANFDDVQALVEDTTRQIRDIMAELHLPELEDYGLAAALEIYAERATLRGNLELIADLPALAPPPLPSDVRIALFRSAQEAISNVLKHADATQLEISLQGEDGRVRLRVEDDGQGFEPEASPQKEAPSWGLKIMRERIESIGGKVQILSEPGAGTRVTFEIERPL